MVRVPGRSADPAAADLGVTVGDGWEDDWQRSVSLMDIGEIVRPFREKAGLRAQRQASVRDGGCVSAATRHPAGTTRTLTSDAECLDGFPIWSPGDLQIVLVLECAQRSGGLRPHATVNRELSAVVIECRLDAFNKLMVRHALVHRGSRWCGRLRHWRSRRSSRRRRRSSGGLALTRCTSGERTGNHDSRNDAKAMLSCDHEGHPFRVTLHQTSRSLPIQAKVGRSVSKHKWLWQPLPGLGSSNSAPFQRPCH